MRMSEDSLYPLAVDFTAQIQAEIDKATAEALEKKVMSIMGVSASQVSANPAYTSVSLNKEMLTKAINKMQKTTYEPDLSFPTAPWSAGYMELKPPSPADKYDLLAYGGKLDEDLLLELGVAFTEKQKHSFNSLMLGPSFHVEPQSFTFTPPASSRSRIQYACPGVSQPASTPDECVCDEWANGGTIDVIVMHLNDGHKWTREKIADWLDSLDVDLTINLETS